MIWKPSNIYPTAKIGMFTSIGMFSEIGEKVVIGNRVRIGAFAFLCEGVTIEDNCFIGPRFTATNDKYPPSGKDQWKPILIKKGARIGSAVTVLPGVVIGENALVGAGSVVSKSIPAGETWCGVPAKKMMAKE